MLIGDFNLVMNTKQDRKSSDQNNWKAHAFLLEAMSELQLIDLWRIRNSEDVLYSWKHRNAASRIDFCLNTQDMAGQVENIMYIPGVYSDHLAMFVVLDIIGHERGKGYWKFNNEMLKNTDFSAQMNNHLDSFLRQASNLDPIDKWLFMKKEIQDFCKTFSKNLVKEKDLIISQLSEKNLELEYNL